MLSECGSCHELFCDRKTKIVPLLVLIMGEARAVFTVMKGDASRYESIVLIYGRKE